MLGRCRTRGAVSQHKRRLPAARRRYRTDRTVSFAGRKACSGRPSSSSPDSWAAGLRQAIAGSTDQRIRAGCSVRTGLILWGARRGRGVCRHGKTQLNNPRVGFRRKTYCVWLRRLVCITSLYMHLQSNVLIYVRLYVQLPYFFT